ncbi:MAG TPA: ABC transporter substrate-binding protein [Candidatus Saccharimonadales bacterium]|nr:ABC transporter substrate-binding protein [Candidatus Saccharimonadales bacterium]
MKHCHKFGLVFLAAVWLSSAAMVSRAETFRVGFPSLATGFAPSWVAADKGIWKKHGLDVELIFLRGGSRTVSALIGGSVDFIIGSDLGITTAILQGAALTRVGVTTNTLGYSMVSQPAIKSVRDLKGKVIGITPGRDAAYARVVKLLRDNGMDSNKDVSYLSVGDGGPAARVAALSSGVIHATMFTPPSDMISEKAGMRILTKIDVANIGGGLNTSTAVLQKSRPQLLRFLRGYMEAIQYMKSHKDESLKIFSKYVRNPDLTIMAYLYEEIASRVEPGLRPQSDAVRAMLDLAAQDFPQAKRLTEKDNWDLSLIDEIQKSGFLDQLYR